MRVKAGFLFIAVIITGAVLRFSFSVPLIITELVYTPPTEALIPKAKSPELTVRRFYMLIDEGRYGEAFDLIIEPDWVESEKPAPYRESVIAIPDGYYGLVSKEEFITRSRVEMGPNGIYFSISNISSLVLENRDVKLSWKNLIDYPEYEDIFLVKVWGDFLASCAVYRWEKVLPVIKTGDGYRIILDGTKKAKENYYLTWLNFAEKKLIRYLKSQNSGN